MLRYIVFCPTCIYFPLNGHLTDYVIDPLQGFQISAFSVSVTVCVHFQNLYRWLYSHDLTPEQDGH